MVVRKRSRGRDVKGDMGGWEPEGVELDPQQQVLWTLHILAGPTTLKLRIQSSAPSQFLVRTTRNLENLLQTCLFVCSCRKSFVYLFVQEICLFRGIVLTISSCNCIARQLYRYHINKVFHFFQAQYNVLIWYEILFRYNINKVFHLFQAQYNVGIWYGGWTHWDLDNTADQHYVWYNIV